ncbi:MAG: DUF2520 domain-containing protein [Myxococcota bacterium]
MPDRPTIAIVGPGRLGRSLAALWAAIGVPTTIVHKSEPIPTADVVLLTVPDRHIAAAAQQVPPGPVVLHCSGATGLEPVRHRPGHGSLHPLMTFPGPDVALPVLHGVPAAIDGDEAGRKMAHLLTESLGMKPVHIPGDRRLYHAAAVLAGNGATVLLAEARTALLAAGIAPADAASLLIPLVRQSIDNAASDTSLALTGPAARGDKRVLQGHYDALDEAGLTGVRTLHQAVATAAIRVVMSSLLPDNDDAP